jgi:hypothetical protein
MFGATCLSLPAALHQSNLPLFTASRQQLRCLPLEARALKETIVTVTFNASMIVTLGIALTLQ